MQQSTPEALLAAISQSNNEVTQGWMRLLEAAPLPLGANTALQAQYLERQSRLWSGLMSGRADVVAQPEAGGPALRAPGMAR